MVYIFIAIFVISTIALLIGLISPSFIIKWKTKASRFHVVSLFLPLIGVSYLMTSTFPYYAFILEYKDEIQNKIMPVSNKEVAKVVVHKNLHIEKPRVQKSVSKIQLPVLSEDKVKEEESFNQNYQIVTNILRKILKGYGISLSKGDFIDYRTHWLVKFKTNTAYDVSMKITKTKQLQSVYVMIEEGEGENLKNIITSIVCSVNSKKLTLQECSQHRRKLFVYILTTKANEIDILNTKNILVKDSYYQLTPK